MTERPNESFFTTAKLEGEARDGWFIPVQRITGELVGGGESFPTYTIDTGVIEPQVALFDVATEGGASTDDLAQASISFDPGDGSTFVVPEGRIIILKANNDAQTVVIKHEAGGSGQFSLTNEEDLSLTTTKQSVAFVLVGTTWKQITFHDDPYLTKYYNFVDYPIGWRVVASDYKIYRCLIANGPSSSTVDPVGDNTETWKLEKDVKIASFEGLTGSNTSVSVVSYDIDKIILTDSENRPLMLTGLSSKTADIAVSGIGGLDTGSEAASTWYYVWLVSKPDGTNGLLLSLSSTAPTLPSEYAYKALIGSVYNNSSGDLIDFEQNEKEISTVPQTAISSGAATSYTLVDLSTIIPPIAKNIRGTKQSVSVSGAFNGSVYISSTSDGKGEEFLKGYFQNTGYAIASSFSIGLVTAQSLYYHVGNTSNRADIYISKYYI